MSSPIQSLGPPEGKLLGRPFVSQRLQSREGAGTTWAFKFRDNLASPLAAPAEPAAPDPGERGESTWVRHAARVLPWLDRGEDLAPPSPALALAILDTSLDEMDRLVAQAAADRPEGVPPAPSPQAVLTQLRQEFSAEIRGSIANFAFAAGGVFLWQDGRIHHDFALELLYALPIDINRSREIFALLRGELARYLARHPIRGDWGRLEVRGEDIEVIPAPAELREPIGATADEAVTEPSAAL
jgi:hypothetical protein